MDWLLLLLPFCFVGGVMDWLQEKVFDPIKEPIRKAIPKEIVDVLPLALGTPGRFLRESLEESTGGGKWGERALRKTPGDIGNLAAIMAAMYGGSQLFGGMGGAAGTGGATGGGDMITNLMKMFTGGGQQGAGTQGMGAGSQLLSKIPVIGDLYKNILYPMGEMFGDITEGVGKPMDIMSQVAGGGGGDINTLLPMLMKLTGGLYDREKGKEATKELPGWGRYKSPYMEALEPEVYGGIQDLAGMGYEDWKKRFTPEEEPLIGRAKAGFEGLMEKGYGMEDYEGTEKDYLDMVLGKFKESRAEGRDVLTEGLVGENLFGSGPGFEKIGEYLGETSEGVGDISKTWAYEGIQRKMNEKARLDALERGDYTTAYNMALQEETRKLQPAKTATSMQFAGLEPGMAAMKDLTTDEQRQYTNAINRWILENKDKFSFGDLGDELGTYSILSQMMS